MESIKDSTHDEHETISETDTQITSLNDDLELVFNDLKQQVINDSSNCIQEQRSFVKNTKNG